MVITKTVFARFHWMKNPCFQNHDLAKPSKNIFYLIMRMMRTEMMILIKPLNKIPFLFTALIQRENSRYTETCFIVVVIMLLCYLCVGRLKAWLFDIKSMHVYMHTKMISRMKESQIKRAAELTLDDFFMSNYFLTRIQIFGKNVMF